MVGDRFNKNLSYLIGNYRCSVFLYLYRKPFMALVGIICCYGSLFYRSVVKRKITSKMTNFYYKNYEFL